MVEVPAAPMTASYAMQYIVARNTIGIRPAATVRRSVKLTGGDTWATVSKERLRS